MRLLVVVAALALAGAAVAQDERTQAFSAYQEQNWDEARRLFAAARAAHPEDTELALHERASTQNAAGAAYNAGRYSDVLALLDEAEKIEAPAHIVEHARTLRAQALAELARRGQAPAPTTAAEESVAAASAPAGRSQHSFELEAHNKLQAGDTAGAVEVAHEGLAQYPGSPFLLRMVGRHDPKAAGDRSRRKHVQSGNFTVRFRGCEPDAAVEAQMLEGLAEAEAQLGRDFGFRMDRPVNVIVYASGHDFASAAGNAVWMEASYNGSLQLALESARMEKSYFMDTVTHELAHHMVALQARGRVPFWFNEGVAQLTASNPPDDTAMKAAIAGPGIAKLAQLRGSMTPNGDASQVGLNYAKAYSVVKAMTDRFGAGIVNNLLTDMGGGANFETAFQGRAGMSVQQFEKEWTAAQQ